MRVYDHHPGICRLRGLIPGGLLLLSVAASPCCQAFNLQSWIHDSQTAEKAARQSNFTESERLYSMAMKEAATKGEESIFHLLSLRNLARIYRHEHKLDQAAILHRKDMEILARLGTESPELLDSLFFLADIAMEQGRRSEAEVLLIRALKIAESPAALVEHSPDLTMVLLSLIRLYDGEENFDRAAPVLRRLAGTINRLPYGFRYIYKVDKTLSGLTPVMENLQAKEASAKPAIKGALSALKDTLTNIARTALPKLRTDPNATSLTRKTVETLMRIDPDHTLEYYKDLIALEELDGKNSEKIAWLYLSRGNYHCNAQQLPGAISDYRHAIEVQPQNATAYFLLGNAYSRQGDYRKALIEYDRCMKKSTREPAFYLWRAHAHRVLGHYKEALADYNRSLSLGSRDSSCLDGRGHVYGALKQTDKAINDYKTVLKKDPNDEIALASLGATFRGEGQLNEALKCWNRLLEFSKKNPVVYLWRAEVYAERGEFAKAEDDCESARLLGFSGEWRTCYDNVMRQCKSNRVR